MLKIVIFFLKKNKNYSSLIENILVAVIEALSFLFIARSYSKEIFADWILYSSVVFLMEQVQSGFIWTALIKFLSETTSKRRIKIYIGSGWVIGLGLNIIIFFICYIFLIFFPDTGISIKFNIFFRLYPFYFLFTLPLKIAIAKFRAYHQYIKIILLRALSYFLFIMFVFANYIFFHYSVKILIIIHIISFSFAGIISIFNKESGIHNILRARFIYIKKVINYGKYSLGTALGSNLLKNTDIFLIKLLMTNTQLSLYSIPLRIIEVFNIPLTSICNVIFPIMSNADKKNEKKRVLDIFYKYTSIMTVYFIPVLIIMSLFAGFLISLVGGPQYKETICSYILYIFLISIIILPFDRFSGTLLDSINKPMYTFLKVFIMVIINIVGDAIALIFFKSMLLVAVVTILNMLAGNIFVFFYLKKTYNMNFIHLIKNTRHSLTDHLRSIFCFNNAK